jgi:hypothetical protein
VLQLASPAPGKIRTAGFHPLRGWGEYLQAGREGITFVLFNKAHPHHLARQGVIRHYDQAIVSPAHPQTAAAQIGYFQY